MENNKDLLDFVPFLGFIKNDEETISIMAEASVVIPCVCDILGISLSDSENDNNETEPRSSQRGGQINNAQPQPSSSSSSAASVTLRNMFTSPVSSTAQKRCAASTSNPSQSSSSSSSLVLPPKKRRLPAPAQTTTSQQEEQQTLELSTALVRQKLREDIDVFNDKIKQLTDLERQKNRLLENLLTLSASMSEVAASTDEDESSDDSDEDDESDESVSSESET